jgi:hypothetical protein
MLAGAKKAKKNPIVITYNEDARKYPSALSLKHCVGLTSEQGLSYWLPEAQAGAAWQSQVGVSCEG